jgi:hypothetical protein
MQFDRSKFKKTSIEEITVVEKKVNATMGSQGGYTQFISPVEGENIFRILPSVKGICYAPLKTSKLKVEKINYDENGKKVGTEIKESNVFCADVHGPNLLKGKDPIVTYISYVQKKAEEEIQDAKEREKYLFPINGGYVKGSWVFGIAPMLAYVAYVVPSDSNEIRKLQLRPAWLKRMKEISIEQSEDDTLSLDVFSGVDDGYPLRIVVGKDSKGKKKTYTLSAVTPKKSQSWEEFFEENAISDEILEELSELTPLSDIYIDSYGVKDFKMALDGLKRFDEEIGYDIFADDAFLNELDEMASMLPEDETEDPDEEDETPKRRPATSKPVNKSTTKKVEPAVQRPAAAAKVSEVKKYPPLIKLKAFLEEYIEREYEGTETLPDLSIVELRDWYDLAQAGKLLPFDLYKEDPNAVPFGDETEDPSEEDETGAEEGEAEDPIDESKTASSSSLASTRDRLSALRNKLTKK